MDETRELVDKMVTSMKGLSNALRELDSVRGSNINDLYFKPLLALVAMLIKQDGVIDSREYEMYVNLSNSIGIKPYSTATIEKIDGDEVIQIASDAIDEIKSTIGEDNFESVGLGNMMISMLNLFSLVDSEKSYEEIRYVDKVKHFIDSKA